LIEAAHAVIERVGDDAQASRPLFRPFGTIRRLTGCKCVALLLFVAVAGDAAASSVALASVTRPRLARPITMEEICRPSPARIKFPIFYEHCVAEDAVQIGPVSG
jgi:hypothetical protein